MHEIFGAPIHTYSRAQAIEDGQLIDVSTTAREAGFAWPVALTAAAWADCVAWSDAAERRKGYAGQSESGRLWDVLTMARIAIRAMARDPEQQPRVFGVLRTPQEGRARAPRMARLVLQVSPGDAGEPVITVMMPGED